MFDLEMPLAESGHDRLVRLGVVVHLERRIFVVQAVQALLQLLFVGAVGRVHRHRRSVPRGTRSAADAPDAARVDSVSLVCVFRSLATQPMSPACSLGISMRSLPCAIDRWFSFSAPLRVALYSSSPLSIVPEKRRKNVTSPTCGSDIVLKTCAAHGPSSFAWISTVASPFGALERVQLLHLVGVRHELDDRREHRLHAVVQFARTRRRAGRAPCASSLPSSRRWLRRGRSLRPRDSARAACRRSPRSTRSAHCSSDRTAPAPRRGCRSLRTRPSSRRA